MRSSRDAWFWAPRALAILLAAFLAIFALDALDDLHHFLFHLAPSLTVLLVLALAWRWERLGAAGFAALAGLYLAHAWGRIHWTAHATITAPLFLIAALFLVAARRDRP